MPSTQTRSTSARHEPYKITKDLNTRGGRRNGSPPGTRRAETVEAAPISQVQAGRSRHLDRRQAARSSHGARSGRRKQHFRGDTETLRSLEKTRAPGTIVVPGIRGRAETSHVLPRTQHGRRPARNPPGKSMAERHKGTDARSIPPVSHRKKQILWPRLGSRLGVRLGVRLGSRLGSRLGVRLGSEPGSQLQPS